MAKLRYNKKNMSSSFWANRVSLRTNQSDTEVEATWENPGNCWTK